MLPVKATSPGVAGRPVQYGKFALRPIAAPGGWMISNTEPDVLTQVHENYIKKHEMPPYLQPRARALQTRTNRAISRGFVKTVGSR